MVRNKENKVGVILAYLKKRKTIVLQDSYQLFRFPKILFDKPQHMVYIRKETLYVVCFWRKKMPLFDLNYETWMGFEQQVGDVYTFELRTAPENIVDDYPLLELGVLRLPNDPNKFFTPKTALKEVPFIIPSGTSFPRTNGAGTWNAPEDLKIDKVKISPYISDTDYAAESSFPWDMPFFSGGASGGGGASGEWIPTGDPSTPVPGSVPDHDKDESDDPPGWIFSPQKAGWWLSGETIAVYTTFYGRTDGMFDGAFVWDGIDISMEVPPHIWYSYTDENAFADRPYVFRPLTWRITLAPAWTRGFYNHYESSGSNYWLEQDRWHVPNETTPYVFYPNFEEDTGGGGVPATVEGIGLLGAFGLGDGISGGQKPLTGIDIFKWLK